MTHLNGFDAGQFYGFHGSRTSQYPPDKNGVGKYSIRTFFYW
jgi:hypothetical protein